MEEDDLSEKRTKRGDDATKWSDFDDFDVSENYQERKMEKKRRRKRPFLLIEMRCVYSSFI